MGETQTSRTLGDRGPRWARDNTEERGGGVSEVSSCKETGAVVYEEITGLYGTGWGKDILSPESYGHPAKMSTALLEWIGDHIEAEGWLVPGATVLDCFGGTGTTGWMAMNHGWRAVLVEVEQPFCDVAQGCDCTGISREDYRRFAGRFDRMRYTEGRYWCPRCMQQASQPPARVTVTRTFRHQGKPITRVITPLPFPDRTDGVRPLPAPQASLFGAPASATYQRNSHVIPHTEAHHYEGNLERWAKQGLTGAVMLRGDSRDLPTIVAGQVEAVVTSPVYHTNTVHDKGQEGKDYYRRPGLNNWGSMANGHFETEAYSTNPHNLGNTAPTTFWEAVAQILRHCFDLLVPGGHAIFVTGPYVREGKLVDFPEQWRRLCEQIGFVTLHEHRMLKKKVYGRQHDLWAGEQEVSTSFVSFFRRISNKKNGVVVDWETVHCLSKPILMPPDEAWRQLPLCDGVVSSPPYNLPMSQDHNGTKGGKRGTAPSEAGAFARYGNSAGQLEGLPPGDLAAVISSPPYAGAGEVLAPHNGIDWTKAQHQTGKCLTPGRRMQPYGTTEGNLGSMPTGEPLGGEVEK